MDKKFYLIVILVLFSLDSVLLLKSIEMKGKYGENFIELQNKFNKFKDQSSYNLGLISKYKNKLIPIHVIDSIGQSNLLLYLYSDKECPSCVIEDIEAIGKFAIDSFIHNVLIVPINLENQPKKLFLNTFCKELNRYPILCEQNTNIPRCFFLIDSSGEILLPYFSRLGYEENRNQYLDFVFNQYFASKAQ